MAEDETVLALIPTTMKDRLAACFSLVVVLLLAVLANVGFNVNANSLGMAELMSIYGRPATTGE